MDVVGKVIPRRGGNMKKIYGNSQVEAGLSREKSGKVGREDFGSEGILPHMKEFGLCLTDAIKEL
jgi:hypothetical protein